MLVFCLLRVCGRLLAFIAVLAVVEFASLRFIYLRIVPAIDSFVVTSAVITVTLMCKV
jgi:hypothetical protein